MICYVARQGGRGCFFLARGVGMSMRVCCMHGASHAHCLSEHELLEVMFQARHILQANCW